jgi:hypothetical protein
MMAPSNELLSHLQQFSIESATKMGRRGAAPAWVLIILSVVVLIAICFNREPSYA